MLALEVDALGGPQAGHHLERLVGARAPSLRTAPRRLPLRCVAAPDRASVHCARARALIALGSAVEARAALDQAKKLDPQNTEADELYAELPSEPGFGGD